MKLNPAEMRTVVYLARRYRNSGEPMWPPVTALSKRLETAVLQGDASPWRQPPRHDQPHLERVEFIGTRLAAKLLGWSERRVQRHAADLDGRRVGDRLVYPAHRVAEYADHLNDRSDD